MFVCVVPWIEENQAYRFDRRDQDQAPILAQSQVADAHLRQTTCVLRTMAVVSETLCVVIEVNQTIVT